MIGVGDDVTPRDWEHTYNRAGKVLNLVPGGYEVHWAESNAITYENDDSVELRFRDEPTSAV